ncbi:MAG TPA: copper resistance protein CopC [Ktedonobacteraceae bacterium]|jgi:methionine-rich copper-binding protein CopC
MQRRRYLKVFLLAILWVSLLLLASWLPVAGRAPVALAHAFVIGSDPIDGSTVNRLPRVVRIYFNAPIASASRASVYAFPPDAPASGLLVNAGTSVVNPANTHELDTALLPASRLPQGGYEVRWTALSLSDGHTTSGLIGFNLGASSLGVAGIPTLGPGTSNVFPQLDLQGGLAVAWDWLTLLALLFWVGMLLTDYLILPRVAPETFLVRVRRHARSLQLLCLLALLVGEVINLILRITVFTQTLAASGVNFEVIAQFVPGTTYGRLWLARLLLLLLALLFHWASGARRPSRGGPAMLTKERTARRLSQPGPQLRPSSGPAPATLAVPAFLRTQARVSGAVASVSPTRGPGSSLPRITTNLALDKTPEAPEPANWQVVCWLLLCGLLILTQVLSNEIVHLTPLPVSAGILSWLSLVAQAAWFGSLAYLGLVLLPVLPATDPDHHAETLVTLLRRMFPWMLASLAVLLVSDVFLTEATIQAPAQLLGDAYGRALLLRALLLLVIFLLTAYLFFFLLPSLQRQTVLLPVVNAEMPARRARRFALERTERLVKRVLNTCSCLAALTLICLALMQFFAPPVVFPNVNYQALLASQSSSAGSAPQTVSQTQQAGPLAVTLQLTPARVGVAHTLVLTVHDARGRALSDATVRLRIDMQIMDMGEIQASAHSSNSEYRATFAPDQTFTMGGTWLIQVQIVRPKQQPLSLTFQVLLAA